MSTKDLNIAPVSAEKVFRNDEASLSSGLSGVPTLTLPTWTVEEELERGRDIMVELARRAESLAYSIVRMGHCLSRVRRIHRLPTVGSRSATGTFAAGDGGFLIWVEEHFAMERSTAYNYMRAAARVARLGGWEDVNDDSVADIDVEFFDKVEEDRLLADVTMRELYKALPQSGAGAPPPVATLPAPGGLMDDPATAACQLLFPFMRELIHDREIRMKHYLFLPLHAKRDAEGNITEPGLADLEAELLGEIQAVRDAIANAKAPEAKAKTLTGARAGKSPVRKAPAKKGGKSARTSPAK